MKIDLNFLDDKRRIVYDFYKLTFSDDGKPMKDMGDGRLVFHPILLPYLITDFLNVYEKTGNIQALNIVQFIANIALTEASEFKDSLVFWYDPKDALSSIPHKFYSALTQSWYIKSYARLSQYDSKYKSITQKFFNSLMIPIEDDGVLLKHDYGWIVEEYPSNPPLYTLNGWLTVLRILIDSEKYLKEFDNYAGFLKNNLNAVKHLLPLYDAGFCSNSRYQLTGFTRFRIIFPAGIEYQIKNFNIEIPGVGVNEGLLENKGRWYNYLEREELRLAQFNIVQSLISYPKTNIFNATVYVDKECEIKCYVAEGVYDPNSTGMPTKGWREIRSFTLSNGNNQLNVSLEWDNNNLFAYPTNFKKDIYQGKGKKFNAYHFIHIIDLASIYRYTKDGFFYDYCNKWIKYMDEWKNLECLDQNKYSLEHYTGEKFMDNVHKMLEVTKGKE